MENEIWKDIPGFEGLYQVSDQGRVRSLERLIYNGHGYYLKKEQYLKPNRLAKGYMQLDLKGKDRKRHPLLVHRIVAMVFIENPNGYDQINHINGIKDDNRVENLEWCNNSLNQLHAWRTGLQTHSEFSGKPKKKVAMLDEDGNIERIFESIAETARFFGGNCRTNIYKCLHKKPHFHTYKKKRFVFYDVY